MKTAVSLPNDLFNEAETAARRLKISRSQLYAKAIAEFLNRKRDDAITESLNKLYSRQKANIDPALHRAQVKSLDKVRL
jgi:metal-responsive CopG/Arc/MetJ family transcriptional regulator